MKLNEYMNGRNISKAEAAKMFGVSLMSIYRYLNGETPTSRVIKRIVHDTGGLVSVSDLVMDKPSSISHTGTEG